MEFLNNKTILPVAPEYSQSYASDYTFLYDNGIPTHIQTKEGVFFPVNVQDIRLDIHEFMRKKKYDTPSGEAEAYEDPDMQLLTHIMHTKTTQVEQPQIDESYAYDRALIDGEEEAGFMDERELHREMHEDIAERVERWLSQLNHPNVTIQQHFVEIPQEGISWKRIIFGRADQPDNLTPSWEIDEAIMQTLLSVKNTFNTPAPAYTTIFSIPPLMSDDNKKGAAQRLSLGEDCQSENIERPLEFAFNATGTGAVVLGRRISQGNRLDARIDRAKKDAKHEVAHRCDEYGISVPTVEGLATFFEEDFSFQRLKNNLRKRSHYGKMITENMIRHLYSREYQQYNFSEVEIYDVSGAFLGFLFEDLCREFAEEGPRKFMDFYSLINGVKEAVYSESLRSYTISFPPGSIPEQGHYLITPYFCQIDDSLNVIYHSPNNKKTPNSADKFMQRFLDAVNS